MPLLISKMHCLHLFSNCHFGAGKLIFETKHCEQITTHINLHLPNNLESYKNRSKSSSFTSSSSGSVSDYKTSPMTIAERKLPKIPADDVIDGSVFDSPLPAVRELKRLRSASSPDQLQGDEKIDDSSENMYCDTMGSSEDYLVPENVIDFAEITAEGAYIFPNEPQDEEKSQILKHSVVSRHRSSRSSSDSYDNDNDSSSSYLQIIGDDEILPIPLSNAPTIPSNTATISSSNPPMTTVANKVISNNSDDILLNSVLSSLQDPMHNEVNLNKKSKSTYIHSETHAKKEIRRASEPIRKITSTRSFEKDINKMKLTRVKGSVSCDVENITQHISSTNFPGIKPHISPQTSKKLFQSKQDGFPAKQNSITHRTQSSAFKSAGSHFTPSTNPFGSSAETFLMKPFPSSRSLQGLHQHKPKVLSIRRNNTEPILPLPALDRNTKPKRFSVDSTGDIPYSEISVTTNDQPPPIPDRYSPNNKSVHPQLQHQEKIKEEDELIYVADNQPITSDIEQEQCTAKEGSSRLTHQNLFSEHDIEENVESSSHGYATVPGIPIPSEHHLDNNNIADSLGYSSAKPAVSLLVHPPIESNEDHEPPSLSPTDNTKEKSASLAPPPLPPKVKMLSLTKSAPLNSGSDDDVKEIITRSSSVSDLPTDEPPEIPSRDHIALLVSSIPTLLIPL